jgi:hypothetical protein
VQGRSTRITRRVPLSRLNTNHWQARFGENAVKPLRQRSSFQLNSLEAIDGVRQNLQESFRLTRHPRFPHDLARIIHDVWSPCKLRLSPIARAVVFLRAVVRELLQLLLLPLPS